MIPAPQQAGVFLLNTQPLHGIAGFCAIAAAGQAHQYHCCRKANSTSHWHPALLHGVNQIYSPFRLIDLPVRITVGLLYLPRRIAIQQESCQQCRHQNDAADPAEIPTDIKCRCRQIPVHSLSSSYSFFTQAAASSAVSPNSRMIPTMPRNWFSVSSCRSALRLASPAYT